MHDANETKRPQHPQDTTQGGTRGSLQELYELLKEFDVALLITQTPQGFLRARPMAMQNPDEVPDCDLWFVTSDETPKVGEIEKEHQVAIACYRPRDRAYLSISAVARVERDNETIKRLWKPDWQAWLPHGAEQTALLKLTLERAEYWEPKGGVLRVLYEQAKAVLTGESAGKGLEPVKHVA
ncbi:pyridoxamine 5'-phosphate oxidase family protein [Chondromyces crocatus]|uniref:Pyridoxamine 5-phosphate oxidase n=1 Tax=Chondromyces crocatus TaxID=52 RepID=A0A0K1E6V6_CHOCO|nr:pyridoxamine 5'-phosphate oxidase family protein [Chondromyces crocatus]AKT36574.1 pyridoxamine 5-phosphate oxidase [Chondromyces crocatus]